MYVGFFSNSHFYHFSAKPGRVVGPVLRYDGDKSIKEVADGRVYSQNPVLPPHGISPHYLFRSNSANLEKYGTEAEKDHSQVKPQPGQCMVAKSTASMSIDMNTNPYYHTQAKVAQLGGHLAIDAKLLQAQTQFGAVGAAAVAVAAHREVSTVQYGLT